VYSFLLVVAAGACLSAAPPPRAPEARALAFLARHVPRWRKENTCYSCHNNGDAFRALVAAVRQKRPVPADALTDTTRWLSHPERWDRNGGDGPFNDRKLARLQFAAALADATAAGLVKNRAALVQAARLVAAEQSRDGSWRVVPDGALGEPATHGTALATHLARRTLRLAGAQHFRLAIARADDWLRAAPVAAVPDAAAVLLGLGQAGDPAALVQKKRALGVIRRAEARRGGWGPYAHTPPEVFDTSLVLLALVEQEQTALVEGWRQRGRAFLLANQDAEGCWPETTRPSGGGSYAQRLSTAGWATLALLTAAPTSSPGKAP
jgi:hypothetical protein